jgi:hypothetical protein
MGFTRSGDRRLQRTQHDPDHARQQKGVAVDFSNWQFLLGGVCVGWIITTLSYLLALAFCRAAARSDPESDYYKGV